SVGGRLVPPPGPVGKERKGPPRGAPPQPPLHLSLKLQRSPWLNAPVLTRSGRRCHPPKLDVGDGDPGRGPTVDRRGCLACLLLPLEQDDRPTPAVGRP